MINQLLQSTFVSLPSISSVYDSNWGPVSLIFSISSLSSLNVGSQTGLVFRHLFCELKVTALQKAQELVMDGMLAETPAIASKQFAGDDALMIEL
jgi:hypothetical protein